MAGSRDHPVSRLVLETHSFLGDCLFEPLKLSLTTQTHLESELKDFVFFSFPVRLLAEWFAANDNS